MKRIIIADDHAVVRTGMQLILSATSEFSIAAECSTGDELMRELKKNSYDLVLLDIHMPGTDSIEILKEIKKDHPGLPVIIFTMNNDDNYMIKTFQNGASAFISKDLPPETIVSIIKKTERKKRYLTDIQATKIAELTIDPSENQTSLSSLTTREYQVFQEIAQGNSYSDIAKKLSLSKNTIGNHRMSILKKLKLKNNTDLVRFAYKTGLLR